MLRVPGRARGLRYSRRARARAAQIRVVGTAFLRHRPLVTVPISAANLALFVAAGTPRAQLIAFALGVAALHAMFVVERIAGARRPLSAGTLARSLVLTTIGLAIGCAVSGRLASPLMPLLLAPTAIAFAAFGRGRTSAAVLGLVVVAAAVLAAVPPPFPAIASPYREIGVAISLAGSAILLRLGVATLADMHAQAAVRLARAGDDAAASAAARAKELETMGARVAHEVKNPLAAIRGLVEVMLEARVDPEDRDHKRLSVVAGEVERIEVLVRDYLGHQRPLAELEPTTVDVGELVRDVAAVLEARAERDDVVLTAAGPALEARVDPRRLKEAILNLALNALDAVGPGARVELAWRHEAGDIVIDVADSGRGMTAAELALLGTAGFTKRPGGTGLGVVLARGAIVQHGGRLDFSSQPGQGTVATIRLPWPRS